jgi:alkylhydroperoxidase family enzyme
MLDAVRDDDFAGNSLFSEKQAALLIYGAKLCRTPQAMCEADIQQLRGKGVSDTEILEAVQATACFAYWVRFINALGIQLGNESIGMYGDASK